MNNSVHELLREFLKTAKISNRKFAKFAGIPVSSFQTILDRKSELKASTYSQITGAMYKIMTSPSPGSVVISNGIQVTNPIEEREHLWDLFDRIVELSFDLGPKQKIKDRFEEQRQTICKNDPLENKLLLAFYSLNEEGRVSAVNQIELLTEIPKYQKIPPKSGQDEN